jgi:hypothetical protein
VLLYTIAAVYCRRVRTHTHAKNKHLRSAVVGAAACADTSVDVTAAAAAAKAVKQCKSMLLIQCKLLLAQSIHR